MTSRPVPTATEHGIDITDHDWWRSAVVYQVYIRSFSDGNGDGVGDLTGLRNRLGHLHELGVDAIWINPWYRSPMIDAGYDVADFRQIDPSFGDLAEAEQLINEAHRVGIRVIADIVPNHVSADHDWFHAALRDEPGAREKFIFRPGRGVDGAQPPNDWLSAFGGPAWSRVDDGSWYLHLFAPAQPDLNWEHPAVRAEFDDILRFWFSRGLDGFRIDVAHGLVKDPALPDAGAITPGTQHTKPHPAWDQEGVHDVYRRWRSVADEFDPPRVFVAEAWVPDNERLARYLRPDELHTAFQFDFLRAPWRAAQLRAVIDDSLDQARAVGAPSTWVLSNHDVVRAVTRYARSQPNHLIESEWDRARWAAEQPDLALGRRRARGAALLQLALPGTAYLYQGDELLLAEHEEIPHDRRQDPTWAQSGYTDVGRDGCRVPIPFSGDAPPYGFSSHEAVDPWLPQPQDWSELTVAAAEANPNSALWMYREALALRRTVFGGVEEGSADEIEWIDDSDGVLAFRRGRMQVWVNTGTHEIVLPAGTRMLIASDPTVTGQILPPDTTVWLVEEDI
ncbi:glycoside hydrolase family 13 protein [Gordonia rhizosphera]|uniref:Alpha-glucosidase n=1 Tax=Gordonia rhizosphera NBRC 16068 TaxID=1108045 RepID=K6WBI8_9ACTN|nr:glycoside hydrolase family 13 protein [Gordonia rhizosphera]GAB91126.1 alpha-glucosidase [Gordonia rhizosphera NBRC 16068]